MKLAQLIPVIAGIVLSLLLTYFPTLKTWYAKQAAAQKALIVLVLSAVVALAYFGIACTPWATHLGVIVACTQDGAWTVATAFGEIVAASQVAYLLTPTQANPVPPAPVNKMGQEPPVALPTSQVAQPKDVSFISSSPVTSPTQEEIKQTPG